MRWSGVLVTLAVVLTLVAACDFEPTESLDAMRELVDSATAAAESTAVPPNTTVDASVESGEVGTLFGVLGGLQVAPRGSAIEYKRRDWRHWVDEDRDCQDTRAEVLIAESMAPVSFAPDEDGDNCRVTAGRWVGPWTGVVFTDASDVDIDHHVPLGHAHLSGGWEWSPERKRAYANDLVDGASLQATGARVNRSKGKQPPDEWRPDQRASWCRYAADWITVKGKWHLTVTAPEVDALHGMLGTCHEPSSWGLSGPPRP